MLLCWFLYIYRHRLVEHLTQCFLNLESSSKWHSIFLIASHHIYGKTLLSLFSSLTLNVLTYPLILGIIKANGLITLSKYHVKYLQLVFALINFEITILSKLNSLFFIAFLQHKTFLLLLLSL